LVEIDNKLSVCDEQVKDWETSAQAILKETSNDVDDNDRPEAAEEPCISIPQGQQMVKQLFKKSDMEHCFLTVAIMVKSSSSISIILLSIDVLPCFSASC
jgi:hypothetical protein